MATLKFYPLRRMMKSFLPDKNNYMKGFENPANIYKKELNKNEDKLDSKESAKTFQELSQEIKSDLESLGRKQEEIATTLNSALDEIGEDSFSKEVDVKYKLSDLSFEMMGLAELINKKTQLLDNINASNAKIEDINKPEIIN